MPSLHWYSPLPKTSPYKYHSELRRDGLGAEANYTGMTWSGTDLCLFDSFLWDRSANQEWFRIQALGRCLFLSLSASFQHVCSRHSETIVWDCSHCLHGVLFTGRGSGASQTDWWRWLPLVLVAMQISFHSLASRTGIHQYGVVNHPEFGKIYAYEALVISFELMYLLWTYFSSLNRQTGWETTNSWMTPMFHPCCPFPTFNTHLLMTQISRLQWTPAVLSSPQQIPSFLLVCILKAFCDWLRKRQSREDKMLH